MKLNRLRVRITALRPHVRRIREVIWSFSIWVSRIRTELKIFGYLIAGKDESGNKVKLSTEPSVRCLQEVESPASEPETRKEKYRVPEWLKTITQFATALTIFIIFLQWRAQVSALQLDQRGWVGIASQFVVVRDLTITDKGLSGKPTIPIKNFGKTPAFSVVPAAEFQLENKSLDAFSAHSCDLVDEFIGIHHPGVFSSSPSIGNRQNGFVLFPSVGFDVPVETGGNAKPNEAMIYIIGCIVYRDAFREAHWTRFCYETLTPQVGVKTDVVAAPCNTKNYTEEAQNPRASR
jgi:hypothetical protein